MASSDVSTIPWMSGSGTGRRATDAQQQVEAHRLRELRGAAEPAVRVVVLLPERLDRGLEGVASGGPVRRLHQRRAAEGRRQLAGLGVDVGATGAPQLVDPLAQLGEGDHAAAPRAGEVGPPEERPAVRREEHGHRPAALPGQRLDGLHVDLVDVRALLAVDLDVDEELVHQRRDLGVLERLVRHHVAPVACRIAHRQQHRLVAAAGGGEGVVTPRIPVDRVVGVLAEVRAGLVGQAVHHPHGRGSRGAAERLRHG